MNNSLPAPYPELHSLSLTADEYYHRGRIYKDVTFSLFKDDYKELDLDYPALIKAPQPTKPSEAWTDWHYAKDFINADLFTPEEVEQVRSYFAGKTNVTLKTKPYTDFPIGAIISVGAVPIGGLTDVYMFDKSEGFDCPISFRGFFDLRVCREVVEVREVRCYPGGSVKFGRDDFTLTGEEMNALLDARSEAATANKIQTVELRFSFPSTASWFDEDLPF